MRTLLRVSFVAGLLLAPSAVAAQDAAGTWLPWIGCWQSWAERVAGDTAVLCVAPNDGGIEAVSVVDDVVTGIDVLAGGHASQPSRSEGCSATLRAEGSAHGNLLFVAGDYRCEGSPARTVHGIHAFSSSLQWIDIQVVAVPNAADLVRVRQYTRMPVPAPLADRLPADLIARATAASERAGNPIGVDDIIESTGKVPLSAVQALLLETRTVGPITRRELFTLDKAGVSPTLIDLVVALAYPKHFDIRPNGSGLQPTMPAAARQPLSAEFLAFLSPFAPPEVAIPGIDPVTGKPVVVWTGNGMVFDRYGDFGFSVYSPEWEIVESDEAAGRGQGAPHGSVQKDKGYTKGDEQPRPVPSDGTSASTAGSAPRAESNDRDSGASGASSSGGYSSGSSSSSTGRTAVER